MHIGPLDFSNPLAPEMRVEVDTYRLLAYSIRPISAALDKFQMGGGRLGKSLGRPIAAEFLAAVFQMPPRPALAVVFGKVWDFNRDLDTGSFPYDPNVPTYCSIDFGYRMPAVLFLKNIMPTFTGLYLLAL